MPAKSLASRLGALRDLPPLSQVVADLQAVLSQDSVSLDSVATGIERDQALSAKALRLANCSLFGVTGRVVTVRDAIGFLGLRTVSAMLTASAISERFPRIASKAFRPSSYWRHTLATAICAREIARASNLNHDFAFTAGLMHDLGRLVLASQAPADLDDVFARRAKTDGLMIDAEMEVLGTDHAELGALVAQRWNFAAGVVDAVRLHHRPPASVQPTVTDAVHAADVIVHALDLAGDPDEMVPPLDVDAWNRLALTSAQCRATFERTEQEVGQLCEALGV